MNNYIIMTDSTADLSQDMVNKLQIEVIPMSFTINNTTYMDYPDQHELDLKTFYHMLKTGKSSSTSQVNPEEFLKYFRPHLEKGNDILYIAFSSGLSGTYASAVTASNELKREFPDRTVIVVDSLCASLGEGLLVFMAAKEKQKGKDIYDLAQWINKTKKKICHWVSVDSLSHLKRGGRISAAGAFLGAMLNIKPIIHVDTVGKLVPVEKIRGRRNAFNFIIEKIEKTAEHLEQQEIFISHAGCEERALEIADMIKNKFPVKDVFINSIGPVIGSHTGIGTIAVFFVGAPR